MSDKIDFIKIMPEVAKIVLPAVVGELNKALSSANENRYGKKGSVSVDKVKGTYFDHSLGEGGGVLDMLDNYLGLKDRDAWEWLQQHGFAEARERQDDAYSNGHAAPAEKFAGFLDHAPVNIFEYFDDKGDLAYQVLKFPKEAQVRYMQRRPAGGGHWIWGLQDGEYGRVRSGDWFKAKVDKKYEEVRHFGDAERWLYLRADVLKARIAGDAVVLVEGEKDVETLRSWGIAATTNVGGAQYWSEQFNDDLRGVDVILCSDNDDPGRNRTLRLGGELRGKAKTVRVIDLAQHWSEMPDKADVSDWRDQAGGTADKFRVLMASALAWKPIRDKPSKFRILTMEQLDEPGPEHEYVIDDFLTDGDKSVIGGPSKSGKSFLAIHAALAIARGTDFFGRPVKQGVVFYQAGEGAKGIKKRIRAYFRHFGISNEDRAKIPFLLIQSKVDLYAKDGDTAALIDEIKATMTGYDDPLKMIVIDTLAVASGGADENSGKDMGAVMESVDRINRETGAHVCLVHHMNAAGQKLRGHTSIYANIDQVILVTRDEETKVRTVKLDKQKDDEDGLTFKFELLPVEIGQREDGRSITSCVVVDMGKKAEIQKEQARRGFKLKPSEETIFRALLKALRESGEQAPSDLRLPLGTIVVRGKAWKQEFEKTAAYEIGEEGDEDAQKRRQDAIRKAMKSAGESLMRFSVIGRSEPFVWWTGKAVSGFPETFEKWAVAENYAQQLESRSRLPENINQEPELFGNSADPLASDDGIQL